MMTLKMLSTILGDPLLAAIETAPGQSRITLDGLFRRVAARRPGAIALADPPNRDAFTDRPPLRLTYAEADRAISAIAGRLRRMGLTTDAIVGIQMPNVAENILTILGVLRAGLIAAPLAAALAACRRRHRAGPRRRQGARHHEPRRRRPA